MTLEVEEVAETVSVPQVVLVDRIEEVKAKLAYADQFDGTEDRIVSKCVTCQLHMAGSADFAVHADEYTVQLCSDHCRESFAKDPVTIALALGGEPESLVDDEEAVEVTQ